MSTLLETAYVDTASEIPSVANWLDENYPGWAAKVNPDTLTMASSALCIGGQIGVYWGELTDRWQQESGIDDSSAFAECDNEWRREVLARQSKEAS